MAITAAQLQLMVRSIGGHLPIDKAEVHAERYNCAEAMHKVAPMAELEVRKHFSVLADQVISDATIYGDSACVPLAPRYQGQLLRVCQESGRRISLKTGWCQSCQVE